MGDIDGLYSGYSRTTESAWAKLDTQSADTLPVTAHLADSAAMAEWLWDAFIPSSVQRVLSKQLGGNEAAKAAVVFSAAVHDCGKISPAFARKAEAVGRADVVATMQHAGLRFPVTTGDVPHGLVGHLALRWWLMDRFGFRQPRADTLASVVGGHHGNFPDAAQLRDAQTNWRAFGEHDSDPRESGACPWHLSRNEILDRAAAATGAEQFFPLWRASGWPPEVQILIGGIVILADWLASNQDFFPYSEPGPGRLAAALHGLNLPRPWHPGESPDVSELFRLRFPGLSQHPPSSLQKAAVKAAQTCTQTPLVIIEAPMGAGKTEAAMLMSEVLAQRFGSGGVFIGLPTMATANPMFDRVLEWLDNTINEDASVSLAHSKASHHDNFQSLKHPARVSQVHDEDREAARTVVASWLTGRKKSTHASFVVGTVDQLLIMALRAKHVSLRHLAMAGKVVVIDECHAADDYMRVYLCRALTWLARLGTPVVLMSATLPPKQRQEYLAAYASGRGIALSGVGEGPDERSLGPTPDYPLITMLDKNVDSIAVEPDGRSLTVRVAPLDDELTTLVSSLRLLLKDGGCAVVIRNTVTRAQEAFDALEAEFGETAVILLHSRFITQHRAEREKRVVELLGRCGERPERLVVVGTQVLEQSLDVDFDVILTDLAPMDLLLQRAGRLHRHDRPVRPPALRVPTLFVTGTDLRAEPPVLDSGSKAVYGASKLLRAAALLTSEGRDVSFPSDIPVLVQAAYAPTAAPPPGWEVVWDAAETAEAAKLADQEARASNFLVNPPEAQRSLVGFSEAAATDPESSKARGKRQVRDAAEGLEVIVLVRRADGTLTLPDGLDPKERVIPEHQLEPIPDDLARQMSRTTLSVPTAMTEYNFDAVEADLNSALDYTNWESSPWLRGQLALVLDDTLQTTVANYSLQYHPRKGLMYQHCEGRTR